MSFKLISGLHDSKFKGLNYQHKFGMGCKNLSFWYRDFVAMCKKFLNNNYLFEMKFLQHFLQLRMFSQATRKAVVGHMLCRTALPGACFFWLYVA